MLDAARARGRSTALPRSRRMTRRRAISAQLFAPGLARTTVLLTVAYFAHIMTFYFIAEVDPEDRRRHGVRAVIRGGCSCGRTSAERSVQSSSAC